MYFFFFRELQLIIILLLIDDSYTSWNLTFFFLKLYERFSIFDSVLFLLKFMSLFNKKHGLLTLKRHNSFQNWSNRKATYSFVPRPLIFKLQRKVLIFNDICVSWSSARTDLEANFWNLENQSFENVSFSQ